MNPLIDLANEKSFYTKSSRRPIRVTFTRHRAVQTQGNKKGFNLKARGSTYRSSAVLYLEVRGKWIETEPMGDADFQIGLGTPTSNLNGSLKTWRVHDGI